MQQSMFIIVYAAASSTAVIMHGVRAVVGGYREAGVQRTWPHRVEFCQSFNFYSS